MPVKNQALKQSSVKHYENISYETLAASWLLNDGWEVYQPMIDHGMKTDLLIADGQKHYRIQIKTLEANDENALVENKWGDANIDFVIYFSKKGNWGYITKPFKQRTKPLKSKGHIRFHQDQQPFARAFELI
ncbi:hypothetical protein [uncultured Psychromonas sp.]|uniref:hypothetical protein n=1 Tax=uncultured Psychromonas sp. TaxID=173974 RepID=UPI00260759D3|nr:hypothetical protein [uncultured Psychromonas sp.]